MNSDELLKTIANGETSRVQFKEAFSNADSIAAELVAMANAKGGIILFGVKDTTGEVVGLDYAALRELGSKVAIIATDFVKPLVPVTTEVVAIPFENGERRVLIVSVEEGVAIIEVCKP